MQKILAKISLGLVLLLAVFVGGYQYGVSKVKVPEKEIKIEYVDRVVEKEVIRYVKVNVKEDSKTTTTKPDGTVIVEEKKSESNTETKVDTKEKTKEKTISVDKASNAKNWRGTAMVGVPLPDWRDLKPVYGASIDHRVIGPFSAGFWYLHTKEKHAGVSISVEF